MALAMEIIEKDHFNYKIVTQFAVATVIWGIVGMLVGVVTTNSRLSQAD